MPTEMELTLEQTQQGVSYEVSDKPCSSYEKGKYHRASFKTKQTSSIKKCLHLLHMDLFRPVTPRSINHDKYTLVIVDEYSRCPVYIHSHKDHLGKFDEKADDGYFLGYSLVSKAFRVFNTRRQKTKETYHITFDESTDVIKFTKPLVNYINILESEKPYESPEPVFLKTKVSSDQNGQADQNDHNDQNDQTAQTDKILYDNQSKHSNHNNDDHIIDNLLNSEDVQTSEPLSFLVKDGSVSNTIPISTNPSLFIPSMTSPAPQDRWSQDKHIELVNIIGDPGAGMLTKAMAKELNVASAHECLYVDFLFEEEPKNVSEALKHPGWVDSMQEELNQSARNKIKQSERGILINQEKYVKDLLKKYAIYGSSVKTPMEPPNKLGPDLNGKYVNETQYRANPKESHLIVVKRIFRYLKGTPSLGLWYLKYSGFDLKGYLDSNYAGCNMDKKSTSSACQLLGGKLVCWSAKKQQSVAMSFAEAEYVAAARCCANILWMKSQLTEYDIIYEKVPIFCDNTSAIAISNNPVLHSRTKHIDIRYHFIRDHIMKGDIELHFIPTQYQLADIFTKPLDEPMFKRLIVELGMLNIVDIKPKPSVLNEEN
ncbi:hypothetical protein Tco_0299218 [Tanacetum coccineum]